MRTQREEQEIKDRYNIVMVYANGQTPENWSRMLFTALVYEAINRTPEEKKIIASVLKLLK